MSWIGAIVGSAAAGDSAAFGKEEDTSETCAEAGRPGGVAVGGGGLAVVKRSLPARPAALSVGAKAARYRWGRDGAARCRGGGSASNGLDAVHNAVGMAVRPSVPHGMQHVVHSAACHAIRMPVGRAV
eukprot:scaffold8794_cov79-Isochrysis_galbana.AAC.2